MSDNQSPLSSPLDNLDALTSATEAAAQDLVSQAAAEIDKVEEAPEVKAPEAPILPKLVVGVTEHSISDADAAKFAGESGDFAMPVSPLDDLGELTAKVDPLPQPEVAQSSAAPQTILPPITEARKTDVAMPLGAKDLEQKAKEMLDGMGSVPLPPNKKKGSAITKMALAAVLMVLMGTGGFVGMNLLTTNKNTDDRSKAANNCRNDQYWDSTTDSCQASGCTKAGYALDGGDCKLIKGCREVSWGVSCGPATNPCEPDLTKGGDWCIENGKSVSCTEVGMIRCNCGGSWAIGDAGGNCDTLCNKSGAICESCGDDDDDDDTNPTPTPTPTFACTGLTSSVAVGSIAIGSPTTFTCAGSAGAAKATFSYTIDDGAAISIPTSTDNPLKSQAVTFTEKGSYKVFCKVCKSDGTTCAE